MELHELQIQHEIEARDQGTAKAVESMATAIKRHEGGTSHGERILFALYQSFQETLGNYVDNATKKNKFYNTYYLPSIDAYEKSNAKYGIYSQISHPFNIIPYVVARELTKCVSVESKLTSITRTVLDTLNVSYNLDIKVVNNNVMATAIGLFRDFIEDCEQVSIVHNSKGTVCVDFSDAIKGISLWAQENIEPHIAYTPMIVPPTEHTSLNDNTGGYITTHSPVLKKADVSLQQGDDFDIKYVNNLQNVGYRINEDLVDLIDDLGLYDIADYNTSERTKEINSDRKRASSLRWESRQEGDQLVNDIKKEQSILIEKQAQLDMSELGQVSALHRTKCLIEKYREFDAIYFPMFCDARGRIYTYCTDLSVQGNKLAKYSLEMAEGTVMNEDGYNSLLNALGGVLGGSQYIHSTKIKMAEDALQGVYDFFDKDDTSILELFDEDELYYGLGIMIELNRYRANPNYITHFIVYIDSCASGTQISSLLLRSGEGARLSNIINPAGGVLTDAYLSVCGDLKEQYVDIASMSDTDLELALHLRLNDLYEESL